MDNVLHLDCYLQPIGKNQAINYEGVFKHSKDVAFLEEYFGSKNIIRITREEVYNLNSNVFSISPNEIVYDKSFLSLNSELRERGIEIEEVNYLEIAKISGLLRCSTMPLRRN